MNSTYNICTIQTLPIDYVGELLQSHSFLMVVLIFLLKLDHKCKLKIHVFRNNDIFPIFEHRVVCNRF